MCPDGVCAVTAGKDWREWLILPKFSLGQRTFPLHPGSPLPYFPGSSPTLSMAQPTPSADTPVRHYYCGSTGSHARLLLLTRPLSVCFVCTSSLILAVSLKAGAAIILILLKRKLGSGMAEDLTWGHMVIIRI